jgi:AcrR family transcriptional regulator
MKSSDSEKIEELILDGVDRLLALHGYDEVSMDSLARELGLNKETIYTYFPNKEDLMLSHVDRIVRDVVKQLRIVAQTNDHPAEKIRTMLRLRVMLRFDSVQHYAESLGDVLRDLRLALLERREFYFEEEAKIFAEVLAQGQKAGLLRVSDCVSTADALIDATNSVLPFNLTEQELNSRSQLEKRTDQITDLIFRGLNEKNGSAVKCPRNSR